MKFDTIIIGGGLSGMTVATALQKKGLRTAVVSVGVSLHEPDYSAYKSFGGRLLMGDTVIRARFEGDLLLCVHTSNLGEIPLEADKYVIATGKFLSMGLVADMNGIKETALGLDVTYEADHNRWFDLDFSVKQPFLQYGVQVDKDHHPMREGRVISNLYAIGELVEGVDGTDASALEKIREEALELADMIA